MILNYKYRLYPNKEQMLKLDYHFFVTNQVWNEGLNLRIKDIKRRDGFTPFNEVYARVKSNLTKRKLTFHTGILQQTLRNLESTFKHFFKRDEKGFPKFKHSSFIKQSFEFKNQGISIRDRYFKILKMKIKWKYHRTLPSFPKKVIIKRESDGKFYVVFSVEVDKKELRKTGQSCGVDLNIENIAVATSKEEFFLKKIKKMEKYTKRYKRIEKELSKRYQKKLKSKNTKKLQQKLNKIHNKVKNVKENFFHNFSKYLVENFDHIRVEELKVKDMKEKSPSKRLRRDISEVSWVSLIAKIRYKAKRHGKIFEEINPIYTSQRCNLCGYISRKNHTTQSKFLCKSCGYQDNADINAAKNIRDYDKWLLEQKALWNKSSTKSS